MIKGLFTGAEKKDIKNILENKEKTKVTIISVKSFRCFNYVIYYTI